MIWANCNAAGHHITHSLALQPASNGILILYTSNMRKMFVTTMKRFPFSALNSVSLAEKNQFTSNISSAINVHQKYKKIPNSPNNIIHMVDADANWVGNWLCLFHSERYTAITSAKRREFFRTVYGVHIYMYQYRCFITRHLFLSGLENFHIKIIRIVLAQSTRRL